MASGVTKRGFYAFTVPKKTASVTVNGNNGNLRVTANTMGKDASITSTDYCTLLGNFTSGGDGAITMGGYICPENSGSSYIMSLENNSPDQLTKSVGMSMGLIPMKFVVEG